MDISAGGNIVHSKLLMKTQWYVGLTFLNKPAEVYVGPRRTPWYEKDSKSKQTVVWLGH